MKRTALAFLILVIGVSGFASTPAGAVVLSPAFRPALTNASDEPGAPARAHGLPLQRGFMLVQYGGGDDDDTPAQRTPQQNGGGGHNRGGNLNGILNIVVPLIAAGAKEANRQRQLKQEEDGRRRLYNDEIRRRRAADERDRRKHAAEQKRRRAEEDHIKRLRNERNKLEEERQRDAEQPKPAPYQPPYQPPQNTVQPVPAPLPDPTPVVSDDACPDDFQQLKVGATTLTPYRTNYPADVRVCSGTTASGCYLRVMNGPAACGSKPTCVMHCPQTVPVLVPKPKPVQPACAYPPCAPQPQPVVPTPQPPRPPDNACAYPPCGPQPVVPEPVPPRPRPPDNACAYPPCAPVPNVVCANPPCTPQPTPVVPPPLPPRPPEQPVCATPDCAPPRPVPPDRACAYPPCAPVPVIVCASPPCAPDERKSTPTAPEWTLRADPKTEPTPKPTPAEKTVTADPKVEPTPKPTPAEKTVTADPKTEPQPKPTPPEKTVTADPKTEPAPKPTPPEKTVTADPKTEPERPKTPPEKTVIADPKIEPDHPKTTPEKTVYADPKTEPERPTTPAERTVVPATLTEAEPLGSLGFPDFFGHVVPKKPSFEAPRAGGPRPPRQFVIGKDGNPMDPPFPSEHVKMCWDRWGHNKYSRPSRDKVDSFFGMMFSGLGGGESCNDYYDWLNDPRVKAAQDKFIKDNEDQRKREAAEEEKRAAESKKDEEHAEYVKRVEERMWRRTPGELARDGAEVTTLKAACKKKLPKWDSKASDEAKIAFYHAKGKCLTAGRDTLFARYWVLAREDKSKWPPETAPRPVVPQVVIDPVPADGCDYSGKCEPK